MDMDLDLTVEMEQVNEPSVLGVQMSRSFRGSSDMVSLRGSMNGRMNEHFQFSMGQVEQTDRDTDR